MKRVGLFVGIDKYKNGITSLQCAYKDAKDLSFAFAKVGYDVDLLQNEEASADNILDAVEKKVADLKRGDIFLFYFAGHGMEHEGVPLLMGQTARADSALYRNGTLSIDSLKHITDKNPGVQRLFILDCCRANILADRAAVYSCPANYNKALTRSVGASSADIIPPLIISSCSTGEVAFENHETGHGFFTQALLDVIKRDNVKSFPQFQNSLKVVGTPKPQNVCWNGAIANWSNVLLLEKWGTTSIANYDFSQGSLEGQNRFSNIEELSKAAEALSAIAQLELGRCYEEGNGVEEDSEQAFYWYEQSALQGNAEAQYELGLCYNAGYGVEEDPDQAFYWYEQSALQGNVEAQYELGSCYQNGYGVEEDPDQAFYWYEQSAEHGNAEAQVFLGLCYDKGYGVEEDPNQAFYWYEQSAEQGNADGQFFLGWCYEIGHGVAAFPAQAVHWYEKAAKQDDAVAQLRLGYCFFDGKGVAKDHSSAVYWYERAAEQGNASAQFWLGECFSLGQGVTKNLKTAAYWYKKSADQGNKEAADALRCLKRKK